VGTQLFVFPISGSLPGEQSEASPACPCPHKPAVALAPVSEDLVEGIKNTAALYFHPSFCCWENRAHSQNNRSNKPSGVAHLAHPVSPRVAVICQGTGGPAAAQPVPMHGDLQLASLLPAPGHCMEASRA